MTHDGKTLLILGGSHCQRSAFAMARARGYKTALFDYLPNPPAAVLADLHVQASTFDVEECLKEAQKLSLSGVMTLGTDQPVYTAACIAAKLGLPGLLAVDTAYAVTHKARMKEIFTRAGIPAAPYCLVKGCDFSAVPFAGPVVLKPTDSQGQRGVLRAETLEEAARLAPQTLAHSREEALLCEAYYPSDEITVSAWVTAGQAHILTVTDRRTFPHPRHIGVCAAHCFPSRAARGREGEVERLTQAVAQAFGVPAGPLYIQMLIGREGIKVNEVACRIGGAFEDVFIPKVTGFDILGAVMDAAVGLPVSPPESRKPRGCVRELMLFAREGRIAALAPLEALRGLPFVLDAGYAMGVGDRVPPLKNAGARLGYAVIWAPDEQAMARQLETFYQTLYIQDAQGNDLLLRRER